MIRTFSFGAAKLGNDAAHRPIIASTSRPVTLCFFATVVDSFIHEYELLSLLGSHAKHEIFQHEPFRIILRVEVFATGMEEIAARLLKQRVDQERTLRVTRESDALHQLEV